MAEANEASNVEVHEPAADALEALLHNAIKAFLRYVALEPLVIVDLAEGSSNFVYQILEEIFLVW